MDVIPEIMRRLEALETEVFGEKTDAAADTAATDAALAGSSGSSATGAAAGTDSTVPKVNPIGVTGGTKQ